MHIYRPEQQFFIAKTTIYWNGNSIIYKRFEKKPKKIGTNL